MSHTITPEQWRRIKTIAAAALDLDEPARAAYVLEACGGDAPLAAEVRSLLDSTLAAGPYFETPAGAAAATLMTPGTRIGPYRIVRELGAGGMGSVYLAERDDGEFGQRVAIKIVRGGFGSPFLLDRFREERRILASLDHPNIARLLDGGTTPAGLPYVVMEFVEGEPIDGFCARRALPLRERLAVFRQVCAAVQHAHQHLVVHRDIKAANILVTAEGTPKLLDFGIAKLLEPQGGVHIGAHTTVLVMTPESASPEQIAGKAVTVATDVYALGVLLYRLLTGRGPYRAPLETEEQVMRAVREQVPDPPSAAPDPLLGRIPTDVDRIVLKALRKEPERRYDSAGQLADDVQRFLDGRPVLAAPDTRRYRAAKFVHRHRVAVTAAAAVLVAVAGGVAATVWQARVAERERQRAQAQFDAVRGLAQSVLGELNDAVEKLPGSTAANEIIVRRATEYLNALYGYAASDVTLRRELAAGYIRLGTIQGRPGVPNLGDVASNRVNLNKAIALLEPIAGGDRADAGDRLTLASALLRLAGAEANQAESDRLLHRTRQIIESMSPAERSLPRARFIRQTLYMELGTTLREARKYPEAYELFKLSLQAAEEEAAALPANLNASRNLSLAYKRNGAVLEDMRRTADAIQLYEKALDLDRRRVAAEPSRPLWRLDLSFAIGALAAAVMKTDPATGLARYEEAVKLREQVVRDDPNDDFARTSLARGYERLALVHSYLGHVAETIDSNRRRIRIYRDRLDAHPDRTHLWTEYTRTLLNAAQFHADLAASAKQAAVRNPHAARARALLDDIAAVQAQWAREKRGAPLPPDAKAVDAVRGKLR
ncbi:MAG TPA: serine/threonine-protein kinase [Vicinamibacterales bacterium]|nr:serine/threonine-protein kinase [Vicinamibacterales bacterium]